MSAVVMPCPLWQPTGVRPGRSGSRCTSLRGLSAALLILAHGTFVYAADCAAKPFRFEEDCRALAGTPLQGLDRLRYVPITASGDWWLQFGGEYRFRTEYLDRPNYGIGPIPDYTAHSHRWLGHALLRSRSGVLVFLELGVAAERGRRPFERSFDRSALDMTQGFFEIPAEFQRWRAALRLGRQEIDSHGNRLLSTRDVSNLRRTFDLARVALTDDTHEISAFAGRPVVNFPGAFDDHWSVSEKFSGVMGEWRPGSKPMASSDFFFFDRSLVLGQSPVSTIHERRRTLGLRTSLQLDDWDGAYQAAWQWGDFGHRSIRAYGLAGEMGYTWRQVGGAPRAGVSFGWASGDADPARGPVGTFDVQYPNLSYFTDAPLSYPGNTADIRPTLGWSPVKTLKAQVGADAIFRIHREDAVYAPPGIPLIPAGRGQAGQVVTLADARLVWTPLPHWEVIGSGVYGFRGDVLREAGGHDAKYLLLQITFRL